ncbi:hypothetical protein D3C83_241410 [compost metagenome]
MIEEVFVQEVKPAGLTVGDEVDLVALLCQRFSKFRCYNATTAKRGITDNSNLHHAF